MSFPCELQERPAQPALTIRQRAPARELAKHVAQASDAIRQYLARLGQAPAGPMFAVYYNEDQNDYDFAIGFPVTAGLAAQPPIESTEIPAGSYAVCTYTGPYNKLGEGYAALEQWCQSHGYTHDVTAYEMYLDDPATTPHAQLRTLVMRPVHITKPNG